jgi:hypothetical protein
VTPDRYESCLGEVVTQRPGALRLLSSQAAWTSGQGVEVQVGASGASMERGEA